MIKIYHYEPTRKFFLGAEEKPDRPPGVGLPGHSTDIAPPNYSKGYIPVFDEKARKWTVVEDNFWRPRFFEINYDAGRSLETYEPLRLAPFYRDFPEYPSYPSIPMLCNSILIVQTISQKIKVINKKFSCCLELYDNLKNPLLQFTIPLDMPDNKSLVKRPTFLYEYKSEIESILFLMKQVLDYMVQLTSISVDTKYLEDNKIIKYDSIGRLIGEKEEKKTRQIIFGNDSCYKKDNTNFLEIINDLCNSFKHCLINVEINGSSCKEFPTILSLYAKNNSYDKDIYYHNHNAFHIMMGFQDSFMRILDNQKEYIKINGGKIKQLVF